MDSLESLASGATDTKEETPPSENDALAASLTPQRTAKPRLASTSVQTRDYPAQFAVSATRGGLIRDAGVMARDLIFSSPIKQRRDNCKDLRANKE
eukprot:scaffold917_cov168-Ochromonas_danica.AAC.13